MECHLQLHNYILQNSCHSLRVLSNETLTLKKNKMSALVNPFHSEKLWGSFSLYHCVLLQFGNISQFFSFLLCLWGFPCLFLFHMHCWVFSLSPLQDCVVILVFLSSLVILFASLFISFTFIFLTPWVQCSLHLPLFFVYLENRNWEVFVYWCFWHTVLQGSL